ncbi:lipopolysaccharide biosynthesis protein [Rossellomorea sp. BNER]|uniref:lipopolysaccharide biosynthesis protein n=1 Tax=Rossellomorea sp. BNER TaxID=2962031 RepID=UPI003AF2B3BD|nr:oligosaccharide flippase family protein [Rossellomorea sp. BNER]
MIKKNSIAKNIFHLFYSTVLANILNATTLIILANYFNAKNYGMFSVALSLSMVMNFCTDLGVSNTFLREGSKKEKLDAQFTSYLKIRLICLIFTVFLFTVGIHMLYQQQEILHMIYSLLFPMLIGLTMQSIGITYFQLMERMQFIAFIKIITSIVLIISIILCMALNVDVHLAATLYGTSYLMGGLCSLYLVRRFTKIVWKSPFQKQLLKKLSPFLLSGLLMMLIPQIGPLVLEKTLAITLVGLFAVSYRIPSALYQIPGVIAGAFFPMLFKQYNQGDLKEHARLNILQMKIMSLMGMGMTISIFYLAAYLVTVLFGDEWGDAVELLKILSFIIVLQGFNIAIADGLTTRGLQSRRTIVQFTTIVFGIMSLYFLSLTYAVVGAAYAVVIMESISFIGYVIANPIRRTVIKRVVLPYGTYFSLSFLFVHFFLNAYPFIAMCLTIILILTMVYLLDQTFKNLIADFLSKRKQHKTNYGTDGRHKQYGKIAK